MDFENLRHLMISDRTVRRFREDREVTAETLERLVELTRYCPSGRNAQPLRYILVTSEDDRERVYPLLKWAGYFKDWDGPEKGERPAAYIIQCLDTKYGKECLCDDGLQLEAITLGMHTLGLGGCIIKAFNAPKLAEVLDLDNRYVPRYVLALGYPAEEVKIEDMPMDDDADFKYYRTADGVHHVPKRPLEQLIIRN
ncbi:MAG: nitroreductase family protein [Muribaculaceae bacterium]|nr:nitroreductase family protein [Muribaculaceae bacterium]